MSADLQTLLMNAMIEGRVPREEAIAEAADVAARLLKKISKWERDKQIADLFPTIGADGVVEKFGVCRRTAYYIMEKKCKKFADDCTKAA